MIRELPPHITTKLHLLSDILKIASGMTFSKSEAMKIVGSRYVLERLVALEKIRMTQTGRKWFCNAGDVLKYANYKEA